MSELKKELFFIAFVIVLIVIAGKTERKNGRIEMCEDLGMRYLKGDRCITDFEFQTKYNSSISYDNDYNILSKWGFKNATVLQLK